MKFSPMILLLLGRRVAAFSTASSTSRSSSVLVRQMSATTVEGEETKTEEVATKMPDMDDVEALRRN